MAKLNDVVNCREEFDLVKKECHAENADCACELPKPVVISGIRFAPCRLFILASSPLETKVSRLHGGCVRVRYRVDPRNCFLLGTKDQVKVESLQSSTKLR